MYTTHGHHIPFTFLDDDRPEEVAECGGARVCPACTIEALPHLPAYPRLVELHKNKRSQEKQVDYQAKAKKIVYDYVKAKLEESGAHPTFGPDEVYVVWFSKTLQNWKALISTTLPDGMYYEVTYDGDKHQSYLDAYEKRENLCILDDNFADSLLDAQVINPKKTAHPSTDN